MRWIILAVAGMVAACSADKSKDDIFQPGGVAIGGYDPVAFFAQQKPVKGDPAYRFDWKDARWQFASQADLDSFRADPEKYAPQYGGYCAYGVSQGHKSPTKIDTWTVLDGKLYFNYNQEVKQLWNKDRAKYIEEANAIWQKKAFTD